MIIKLYFVGLYVRYGIFAMSNQKDFFSGNSHSQKWMENVKTLCSCSHCLKRHEPPV